ncbi:IS110 family transposase (plasmid) [Rhodococcus oxybenzonivorans]|uniref:IS110 family transposase n=1 Tax=Rhodococcus oxybenzonivorans TaxID=1990687 RepID=A0A2S2C7K0_9NOCA|nr:IS110 family transposase [Rhodococcus oxybenzonivorans]AWK76860.1 IS110 family transposase [Rhodococcus oxybenzonivorans]
MIVIGIDAHKRTHTAVSADQNGSQLSTRTIRTTSKDHLALLRWGAEQGDDRMWAIEDCWHLSRRLERVVRVPPKLMANVRDGARTYGKSDPIDALAVARAVLREPNLPEARLDGMEREIRLLVDHRDDLVAERTRIIGRLRWHSRELDPGWTPPKRLERASAYDKIESFLSELSGLVSELAVRLVDHLRRLTVEIEELATEITTRITVLAPSLLAIPGCAPLTAAKLIGETAGVDRFRSKDAFARHNGTAPLPVWSSNRARHRLSRTGNRRLNAAIHIIALSQAHCHDDARALLSRRKANGDGGMEALRILKRRLSDVVYRAMIADRPLMGSATAA